MSSTEPAAVAGIITKVSSRSIEATVSKLTDLIHAKGMKVFAVIDQSAEAHEVGLELRPTTLVIFGNPTSGTAVMDAVPLSALDLPLKVLVWAAHGQTNISYLAPVVLAERYDLDLNLSANLAGIEALTEALIST